MNHVVCVYHDHCLDGYASASVVLNKFGIKNVTLIPGNYSDDDLLNQILKIEDIENKDLYIVDFSFKSKDMHALEKACKSLTLIDHHVSAQKELESFEPTKKSTTIVFDMNHCGAVLTYKHLHPNKADIIPFNLQLVEDRDLWKFNLEHTKAFTTYVYSTVNSPIDYLDIASKNTSAELIDIISRGIVLLRANDERVRRLCSTAFMVEYKGMSIPIVNCSKEFASDVGHMLCKIHNSPFSITYQDVEGKRIFSLRGDGSIDVSAIAKEKGGGGHHDAAGFTVAHDIYKYL